MNTIFPRLAWWSVVLCIASALNVRAERLPVKIYTSAEGLAHDHVRCIVRDSRGFLWFCTAEGLSRFDGYRFTTYSIEHGLPHPSISDLVEDSDGVYWVATYGGGVCRFSLSAPSPFNTAKSSPDSRVTVYPVGDGPGTNLVNALHKDRAGRLWAGTDDGLFLLDAPNGEQTFRRVEMGLPPHPSHWEEVAAFVEDREGSLWIGTSYGVVRRLPDGRMIYYTAHPSGSVRWVRALLQDHEGRLWVGHAAGLIVFNPEPISQLGSADSRLRNGKAAVIRFKPKNPQSADLNPQSVDARWYTVAEGLSHNPVVELYQAANGQILVGTHGGGLSVMDGERFRSYTTAQGLSDNTVWTLAEDRDGNLWMGTLSGGAIKFTRNGFTTYGAADGLGNPSIVSIFENQAGELCVISSRWLINLFDGSRFTAIQANLPADVINLIEGKYYVAIQDHIGEWWISADRELLRFPRVGRVEQLAHMRPKAVYTTRDGLGDRDVYRLFEDSRGDIWISGRARQGLTRWERSSETFHRYSDADGLPPFNYPNAFGEDSAGNLWIGLREGGLVRYTSGRFELLTTAEGVPRGVIRGIYRDRTGRLWVATDQSGVIRIDDPTAGRPRFVTYTTAEGLASDNASSFTEDQWGRIYIGTVRGVDRLDPATGHVKHYSTTDGLSNNDVRAAFRDRYGALWFGTPSGVSRFVPEPDRALSPPPILIAGLRIAGVRHPISELGETEVSGFELAANQNNIQIDFFGLGFSAGEVLRYQYKLEGADSNWGAPTDSRNVTYANLQPGTYRFLVRAVNADGVASPSPAVFSFRILRPVWQRWWFLALAAVLAAASIHLVYRYRVRRLLELERIRTRIATDLHDDIGSSLSQISVLSEVVRRRVKSEPSVIEPLTIIGNVSRDLVDSLSDIVWAINPKRDRLSDLVQRMRRFASDVLTARDVDFRFDAPDVAHDIKLGPDMRREVFLIFKEAVNNTVRHSGCTQAEIEFALKDGHLELSLNDNGKGFDPEQADEGNGLFNMRERAAKLGGALEIISQSGRGTNVKLIVPLEKHSWI